MNRNTYISLSILILALVLGSGYYLVRHATRDTPTENTTQAPIASPTQAHSQQLSPTAQITTEATPTQVSSNTASLVVTGNNFSFTPSTLTAKKGDTIKLTFKNTAGFHDLVIPELNANTRQIGAGEEQTVTFIASKTGSFEYYCSVSDHRAKGMTGTLIIN